jgi:hypothetical protein
MNKVLVENFNYLVCDIPHNYHIKVTNKLHKFQLKWYNK